jgi:hypothetical protein
MRYIIDAALLQADLLNRTLILPSFVYARACEYNMCVFLLLHLSFGYASTCRCHMQHGLRRLCNHGQQGGCYRLGRVA